MYWNWQFGSPLNTKYIGFLSLSLSIQDMLINKSMNKKTPEYFIIVSYHNYDQFKVGMVLYPK